MAEYAQYVAKRWWWLVVGGLGGVLTVIALVTTISLPTWLGVTVLFAGLIVAQSLAFKDMRVERNQAQMQLSDVLQDRWERLRKCYVQGRKLQERIALRVDVAPGARLQDVENKNRSDVYNWTKSTWEVLQEYFPGREQDFMGPQRTVIVKAYGVFDIYCETAIKDHHGNSTDRFLEAKLTFIASVLDQRD